jgi:hypothetical protein
MNPAPLLAILLGAIGSSIGIYFGYQWGYRAAFRQIKNEPAPATPLRAPSIVGALVTIRQLAAAIDRDDAFSEFVKNRLSSYLEGAEAEWSSLQSQDEQWIDRPPTRNVFCKALIAEGFYVVWRSIAQNRSVLYICAANNLAARQALQAKLKEAA